MYNNYIYIAVMALVSYTIRILPLTLIRKPIKKSVYSVVSVLRSIRDAVRHDLPGDRSCNTEPCFRRTRACRRHRSRMVRCKPVSGFGGMLCRGVCD